MIWLGWKQWGSWKRINSFHDAEVLGFCNGHRTYWRGWRDKEVQSYDCIIGFLENMQNIYYIHHCNLYLFSEASMKLASEGTETLGSPAHPRSGVALKFAFKVEDKKGRMHRFYCGRSSFYCIFNYYIYSQAFLTFMLSRF